MPKNENKSSNLYTVIQDSKISHLSIYNYYSSIIFMDIEYFSSFNYDSNSGLIVGFDGADSKKKKNVTVVLWLKMIKGNL